MHNPKVELIPENSPQLLIKTQQIIAKHFPDLPTEIVQNGEVLVVDIDHSSEKDDLWGEICETILSALGDQISQLDSLTMPMGELDLPDYYQFEVDFDGCVEFLKSKSGQQFFLSAKSSYAKIQKYGLHLKSQKIRDLIERQKPHWTDVENQQLAADILIGNYEYLLPIIAGIKPAAVFTYVDKPPSAYFQFSNKENLIIELAKKLPEKFTFLELVKREQAASKNIFPLYALFNRNSAEKVIQTNPKIFTEIGLNDYQKITNSIPADPLLSGAILGFDLKSVEAYSQKTLPPIYQRTGCFQNIWGLAYCVMDRQDPDYLQLKRNYDWLQKQVETLLESGQTPTAVLDSLQNIFTVHEITQSTTEQIRPLLAKPNHSKD